MSSPPPEALPPPRDRTPPASSTAVAQRMSVVRRRDTRPELELRRELHARGRRYRVDVRPVPGLRGRADIVFPRWRVAVYVDGCFWHACPEHGNLPKANRSWWRLKFTSIAARDADVAVEFAAHGWLVVRVWEHEDPVRAAARIAQLVAARG